MNGWINFYGVALLMIGGLYVLVSSSHLVRKILGLNIFQSSVFLFFISLGKISGGTAPIIKEGLDTYTNPLPHVLILTAIVVSVATTTLALALILRIKIAFGTVEDNDIAEQFKSGEISHDE